MISDFCFCAAQEVKNNPVFLITEEDLKQASALAESVALSKKERKDAERRKKAAGPSTSVVAGSMRVLGSNLLSSRG